MGSPPKRGKGSEDMTANDRMAGLQELREAAADLHGVTAHVVSAVLQLEMEKHWLVPPWARPHCSLDPVKPCTSWTCLVDRCARANEDDNR